MYSRLLSKLVLPNSCVEETEHETAAYPSVHEDSSAAATTKATGRTNLNRSLLHRTALATLLLPLRAYRRLISPWLGTRCRFHPSCSAYAECVLIEQGITRGLILALWRLVRCHPWNPGGYDPPPIKQ